MIPEGQENSVSIIDKLATAFHSQSNINPSVRPSTSRQGSYSTPTKRTSSTSSSSSSSHSYYRPLTTDHNNNRDGNSEASCKLEESSLKLNKVRNRLSATFQPTIKEDIKWIEPKELGELLEENDQVEPLMIDMRPLENFEKSRIRNSIHVNIPSLLLKRYKRGYVSNFNLSSFITTPEGNDIYNRWMYKFNIQDNNIQNLPEGAKIIVYDDHMMNQDTAVWTLLTVIAKNLTFLKTLNYLKHGYYAFEHWDLDTKFVIHFNLSPTIPTTSTTSTTSTTTTPTTTTTTTSTLPIPLFKPTPMVSRSASTLSSKNPINVQRRASLFNLDTTPRLKSSNLSSRQPIFEKSCTLFSPSTPATGTSPDVFHTPLEQFPLTAATEFHPSAASAIDQNVSPNLLLQEDDEQDEDSEFDFVISEIIPNFLYLGPEIATHEQLEDLKSRSIKRILNMAEECDDNVPGLKESFKYQKISARDTVEMQNVQGTLKKAVQVIDDSKKHHESIYVHCKAGKSRSAAAILAYLVLSEHWTLKRAYRHIVKARPNISPNIGFVAELMKLEEIVHGQVSNFAGTDWQHVNNLPPSPDTQLEMGRLEKAWKRGKTSRHNSLERNMIIDDP